METITFRRAADINRENLVGQIAGVIGSEFSMWVRPDSDGSTLVSLTLERAVSDEDRQAVERVVAAHDPDIKTPTQVEAEDRTRAAEEVAQVDTAALFEALDRAKTLPELQGAIRNLLLVQMKRGVAAGEIAPGALHTLSERG